MQNNKVNEQLIKFINLSNKEENMKIIIIKFKITIKN